MSPTLNDLLGDPVPVPPAAAADLETAARAALRGGRAAMAHYDENSMQVQDKGKNDPVTAADHAANAAILAVLAERTPGGPVLSEETDPGEERSPLRSGEAPPRLWIVDPLDGTKEFLAHNGEFSTMVGLAEAGRATLGAVYQPAPDRLYLGLVGKGAWVVADPLHRPRPRRLEPPPPAPDRLRVVLSRSHGDPAIERLVEALGNVEVVRSGSVGIKCALIAAGEADLYVHPVPYLKEWDTCAPEALLRGAGGRVTDCGGRALEYGKADPRQLRGIFAAGPVAWSRAESAVRAAAGELLGGPRSGAAGSRDSR